MENYMEDYIEILNNDKEYKEVVSILCQRRIRERLKNAITEIVEKKRYPKFNNVYLSKIDFDIIEEDNKLYVQGVYKDPYIKHTPVYNSNYQEDAFNTFKILVNSDAIKHDFGQLACDVLRECVKNFIIISIEASDVEGKDEIIYSNMIPLYKRQRTNENVISSNKPIKVDRAKLVFEALGNPEVYKKLKSIKNNNFYPIKLKIYDRQDHTILSILDIRSLFKENEESK